MTQKSTTATPPPATAPEPGAGNAPPPRRRMLSRRPSAAVVLLVAVSTLLFVWPVSMIVIGAFRTGTPGLEGEWTLDPLMDTYRDPATWSTFRNSFAFAVVVTVLSKTLALVFAWMVARTNTPLRGLVTPMMLVVLAVPTLFFGISWGMLGDQHAGLVNFALQELTGSDARPVNVESWPGLVFVSALRSAAFGYFLLLGPFLALDRTQEEAASMAGAGNVRIFFTIQLPGMAPAVVSVLILGVIIGLEYFELPLLLGTPAGIDVFATQIYANIYNYDPPRYAQSSSLALLLIAVLLILLLAQGRALGGRQFASVTGKTTVREPIDLRRWKWVATGVIALYGLLALVLPLVQLVIGSLQPFLGVYDNWTLSNYQDALSDGEIQSALRLTAALAVGGGLAAMTLAMGFAYAVRHHPGLASTYLRFVTWLPWSIPGTALTLGMLWAYLSVPLTAGLYGSVWLTLIGLVVAATPVAMRTAEPAVGQIGRELEEAAWVSGASTLRAYVGITSRLVLPSFLSGWLLAALLIAGNLAIPLMLSSVDHPTLPIITYNLYTTGDAPQVAALFCLLAAVITVLFAAYWALARVRRRPATSLPPAASVDVAAAAAADPTIPQSPRSNRS